jgi:hypothetical protein
MLMSYVIPLLHPYTSPLLIVHIGARPAGSCTCDRASTENATVSGDLCSCGARPADACTCEKAADGGLLPTETDFTKAF